MPRLICCSPRMLKQRTLRRGMLLTSLPFLANRSNLTMYFTSGVGFDVHEYHKSLYCVHSSIYVAKLWFLHQSCELSSYFWVHVPGIPRSSLTSSRKTRNRVTSSECMEHRKCKALVQSDCGTYRVSGKQYVMIASAKSHTLFIYYLVMRSVVQTRTQPTQQHHCPLCGSEYYYMYWLHELRGPSSRYCLPPRVNKGLVLPCPLVADKLYPCLECR